MKVLPIARILIIDADAERRQTTKLGLTALGVGTVTEAASSAEALELPRQFDVVVVQAGSVDDIPPHPFRDTGDGIPAVMVADGSAHALARAAGRQGYEAAVGMPLLPRLLYRRIGSVLQRSRRGQRPGAPSVEAGSGTAATAG